MFNAKQAFESALETVVDSEFNTAKLSSKIHDRNELITACVYCAFIRAVRDSSLTNREKCAVSDEINPTIYGGSPFDERKTITVLQSAQPFLKKAQIAAIQAVVSAAIQ